ncbi:cilia- and flagella-associated protein 43 isoform X2 [Thrips palmi]|uniref:Cilia- and flagella-associated protein 43 n=1 Tax=Thrips palmi TaxID=161013 RepID=A0A6P8YYW8_THRPL|nr:cilia- and flagella-associated protein 43 isoform X2 [Thrips palmi]
MHLRKSLSYPQWAKLGNIKEFTTVGKDTVAVGCGCHILFYSLDGNLESVYIANSKQRGDGVQCVTGHRTAPIFALAEKCINPRILVFSHPTVEGPVSILRGGTSGTYLAMVFSEMEFLITLSGVPDFTMIVWCWRTGVQLACKETGIFSPDQYLSCSWCSPTVVSHVVKGESRLQLWDINVCAKLCCLNSQEVKLPDKVVPVDVSFTNDGALFFVDTLGDVYEVDFEEFAAVRRICSAAQPENQSLLEEDETRGLNGLAEKTCDGFVDPCMTMSKAGALIFGPSPSIRLHKRFGDWSLAWTVDCPSPLYRLVYLPEPDAILAWTIKGELVMIDVGKNPKVTLLKYYGTNNIDMELIYPDGNTIVSVNTNDELQVWDKENGRLMGVFDIHEAAEQSLRPAANFISMKANPHYPYVGLAMSDGLLILVSILYPSSPSTLAKFLLCEEEISSVCFAPAGDVLVAFTAKTGQFFLIQGVPGQEMQIVSHLVLNLPVVDCILLPDEQPVLAILFASEINNSIGNVIALYTLEADGLHLDSESQMEHFYTRLVVNASSMNICFGSVHCSRNIHLLEVGVTLKGIELTGHQLRSVYISGRIEYGLLTYGMDGIVIARPMGSKQQFYIVLPHHRSDFGTLKAFQDPKGEFVISLGKDKSLICSKLKRTAKYTPGSTDPSPEMVEKFQEPTIGFFPEGEYAGLTWLQYREKLRIAQEERQYAAERAKIMEEFQDLQRKVVEMLDANQNASPEEQLPISAFDLDKDARESAMEEGRQARERLKAYTTAKITVLEEKSALIREHCWDPVTVKPTSIESLQHNYRVDNYALLPESQEEQQALEMVVEIRKMEMKASAMDSFHPWVSKTDSEMAMQLMSNPASIIISDETTRLKQALVEEQGSTPGDSVEQEERESEFVMCGSSIYNFIQPSPYHISQFELNTYLQTAHSIVLLQKDVRSLQECFNDKFAMTYQAKQKEMNTIKQLHQNLRHIFKELWLACSVEHSDPDPIDPDWTQFEKPEMMLTVEDKEVGIEPYISPSEQALRQQQAEEEERIRLLLLADNFRELALIKMMDGVLEIRLEDELKKDIPKPKCMIEKNPENFTEDDLREVKAYENLVVCRMNERQQYQNRLISDYRRVKRSLKDRLKVFEDKLLDLFNMKLRVEASCTQQTLRILRSRLLNPKRNVLAQKEDAARNAIMANQKALADEQLLVAQLQEATADCRAAFDAQTAKDKGLDLKFKKELPELSPMMAEAAFRLYRKRPKIQLKALVSATLLNEVGRCAVAGKKPSYLPPECLEVLKGIDFLDSASNAPPNMNPDTWANVCRLRRQRIESEWKIKALAFQIAEAENTVSIFQKSVKALKERDKELQANLRSVQEEQLLFEHDVEIQLAIKQGLVEIPTTGSLSDYDNAILINRKDVAYVNQIIQVNFPSHTCTFRLDYFKGSNVHSLKQSFQEAGHEKLRAMRAACKFRRSIVFQEWEHQKVRMHIEDKEDELKTIESVKVIKELQEWLHKRQKESLPGRGVLTLDKEMSRIRAGFERYIKLLGEVVTNYDKKIASKNRSNRQVDKAITDMNVEVNELQFGRDLDQEKSRRESQRKRMDVVLLRTKLIRTVLDIHKDILLLESELDSLKLRTYPILENAHRRVRM